MGTADRRIAATYDYRDKDGSLLFQVVRTQPKSFYVQRPDGNRSIRGVGTVSPVLYRLPDIQGCRVVGVPEGEKNVDDLWKAGLPSTTNPFGADNWRDEFTRQLKSAGAEAAIVFADNDAVGRQRARTVAGSCLQAGLRVKVVPFVSLPEGGDVSDWLAAQGTRNPKRLRRALFQLIKATPWFTAHDSTTPSDPVSDSRPTPSHLLGGVLKGQRNVAAARLAGHYISQGLPPREALTRLREWNQRNDPPLPERELKTVLISIVGKDRKAHPERWAAGPDISSSPDLGNLSEMSITPANHHWRIIPSPIYLKELTHSSSGTPYLWGKFLPQAALVLIIGEASAGKTMFLHRLAHSLVTGRRFLGFTPPRRLRVLHVDVESPATVEQMLLRTISTHPQWHFAKVSERSLLPMLKAVAKKYAVIIIDSLLAAAPVIDENSNAGASQQMWKFVKIARTKGASIIIAHNAGEGNPKEKFKARGATARVDRADEVLNFDEAGEGRRRLKVVKSRFGNLGDSLEFAFAPGYNYTLLRGVKDPKTKQQKLERNILKVLRLVRSAVSRKRLAGRLSLDPRSPKQSRRLDRALKDLLRRRWVAQPERGLYRFTRPPGR